MMDPNATNQGTCRVCGWTKEWDAKREYRGGHTVPETKGTDNEVECHGRLDFVETAPAPKYAQVFTMDADGNLAESES